MEATAADVKRHIGYAFEFRSKVDALSNEIRNLKRERESLHESIEAAQGRGEVVKPRFLEWRTEADNAIADADEVVRKGEETNFKVRYRLGKKADQAKQDIVQLLEEKVRLGTDISSLPALQQIVKRPPLEGYEAHSRNIILNDVMDALSDSNTTMVGLYGMGGIGKTTLAEEIYRQATNESLFCKVVIAKVTAMPHIRAIQDKIARFIIGSKLEESSDDEVRASELNMRLKGILKDKKILIILDDIWSELDLDDVGIPTDNKGCKILITSRRQELLSEMGSTKNFSLQVLSKEESMSLFEKKVTVVKDREIAEEILGRCAGFPLMIITIAELLKNKKEDLDAWKDVLTQLKKFDNQLIKSKVYSVLKLSYDHLPSTETKQIFLLYGICSRPSFKLTDLLWYSFGLGLFKDYTISEARRRLKSLIDILKDCSLLDIHEHDDIRMHDVVREVAISIAREEGLAYRNNDNKELTQWPSGNEISNCSKVSMIRINIENLPKNLGCPNVEFLLLFKRGLINIPDSAFQETKQLKVLHFRGVKFVSVPASLYSLQNLHTLYLENCKLPNLDSAIGKLENLEILSFRGSDLNALPCEVGQLTRLKLLDLSLCHKLKSLFLVSAVRSFSQLEEIKIMRCNEMEALFVVDDESTEVVEFPCLRNLDLTLLPKFKCFLDVITSKSSKTASTTTKLMSLFNEKVALPSLETLELYSIDNIKMIWSSGASRASGQLNSFSELKNLRVEKCDKLEEIVEAGEESTNSLPFHFFPQLTSLTLRELRELRSLYPFGHTSKWPRQVEILGCPKTIGIGLFGGQSHITNQGKLEVVLKLLSMTDGKTRGKALRAASEIAGVESVAVEPKEQTLTVIGSMDPVALVKKLKKKVGEVEMVSERTAIKERKEEEEKKVGEVEIVSVGPAREEEEKKVGEVERKEENKEDKKEGKKKTTEDAKGELIMPRDEVGESSTSSNRNCSVFLSFRGADVRYNFADRFYHALLNVGLLTFRDGGDDEMDTESGLDARRVLRESKVAVIIFSKDFASSTCCLEKVAMLMQLKRRGQVLVLPVFFKVDPSDVQEVKGTYGESFERHEEELKETFQGEELLNQQTKLEEWRDALHGVAEIAGHVYKQGYWSDFIRVVVDRVWRLANLSTLGFPFNPVASSSEHTYDAFLCLGVNDDIRHDFGDWLYHELLDAGLFTFRNDNNKGTELESKIKQAISESKVAVILFSRDFASSTYCLDEVVMIMKRWKRKEVEVLPIFFMVEPDDALEVKGTFGESFKTHEEELKSLKGEELEKMKCKLDDWRAALQQVAEVTDHHEYTKGYWSQFIQGVVDDARSLANIGTLEITPYSSENTYDVFLSLSGDEARHDFGDWLYHALQDAGLHTFWTDKYKEIDSKSDIMKAISESKVAIIIFSRDFASSAFCLDEVAMFMECQKMRKAEVLPVFFKVEPSDVWEFKGAYAKAFKRYKKLKGFGGEKLPKWRAAIQKVAKSTGHVYAKGRRKWLEEEELAKMMPDLATLRADLQEVAKITDPHVYKGGYLSEFIKRVVENALRLANPMRLNVPSHVVGQPNRFRRLEEWVNDRSSDHCIALLYGEHGIGKKTIAAVVTNQNYKDFDAIVFLDNVAEKSKLPDGIVKLQSNLLSGLGKPKWFSPNEQEGIAHIEEHLKKKRALIVLADLGQPQQFFKLIKDPNCLKVGSKVIVTSVDPDLLGYNFCAKFPVKALNPTESFELFSWHAFGTNRPLKEYVSSDQNRDEYEGSFMTALRYCRGIPSVLKAFASFSSSLSMNHWDELLPRIKEYLKLRNDLKSSFDSSYLGEDDKKLFFDIACFYAGRDHDHVDMVLNNCNLYEKGGFDKLRTMHLVSVDANNKVTMDQLTVDMAREIVRQKTDFVEQRSNIWSLEDGIKLLRKCNERKDTRSLILDMAGSASQMEIKTEAFAEMTNLKLLQLVNIRLMGDFQDFPKDLIWLSWEGMPLYQMPDNISLEDLVTLDLRNSRLQELWNGSRSLKKLKILNLSHCRMLEKTPDFSCLHVPNLEKLILDYCLRLSEIHSSIEVLASLVQLSLKGCVGLKKLPILGSHVKLLDISDCTRLQEMPNGRIESIKELCADQVTVDQRWAEPAGFSFFVVFFSLVKLSLSNCKLYDEKIIDELVELPSLEDLDLSRNLFTALPEALGAFPSLRILSLEECECLEVVRKLPNGLEKLSLVNCKSLIKIDGIVRPSMNLLAVGCVNLIQVGEASRSEVMQREDVEMINNLKLYSWVDFSIGYQIEMANTYTGVIEKTLLQDQPLMINYGIFSFFIRGSKIPEWYDHQTENNFLMLFVQPEPGCRTVGINLCVAYKTREHYSHLPIRITVSLLSDSKEDLYWEYSPVAYATEREEAMMWFSHWKLTGTVEPGDGLMICVNSPTNAVEVTRFGICLASEDEAKQPISRSTWYQKLDVDLSTYQTSPGHFDLVNQRHRCVIPMVL